jgi:hypothetical protein
MVRLEVIRSGLPVATVFGSKDPRISTGLECNNMDALLRYGIAPTQALLNFLFDDSSVGLNDGRDSGDFRLCL